MKKLIALAVAAAAMPAMAAVSVSGSYNVEYVDSSDMTAVDGTVVTTANKDTKKVQSYDVDVAVKASAELDNGTTVSASLEADDSDNDGSITFSGAWGSLAMGDVGGALDSVDGAAIGTARDDVSAGAGTDASATYTFPTLVEGLTLKASLGAEDGGNDATADANSVAAKFTMSGVTVFAGTEDQKEADITGYGFAYSMSGFTIGYGYSETDKAGTTSDSEITALSAGYTTGNLTLAVNTQEKETNSTVTSDITTMSVAYGLGGGVTAYASATDNDKAQASTTGSSAAPTYEDVTRVGVKFSF